MREPKVRAYIKSLKRYATGLDTIQFHKCCDVAGAGIWTVVTVNEGIFEGDDIIIEQSSGVKDKHGKEIYTGDIVEALIDGVWSTGNNSVGFGKAKWKLEVIHNDIRFMDVFRVIGSKNAPDRIYYLFDKELSELEVIGNIHENGDLLND